MGYYPKKVNSCLWAKYFQGTIMQMKRFFLCCPLPVFKMPLWNLKDKSPRLNMKSLGNGQWCVISAVQVKYLIPYLVAFHDVITNCDNISFRSCGIHAEELGAERPISTQNRLCNTCKACFRFKKWPRRAAKSIFDTKNRSRSPAKPTFGAKSASRTPARPILRAPTAFCSPAKRRCKKAIGNATPRAIKTAGRRMF